MQVEVYTCIYIRHSPADFLSIRDRRRGKPAAAFAFARPFGRQRLSTIVRGGVLFLLLFARSAATARRATTTPRRRHTRAVATAFSNSCAPTADGHTTPAVTNSSPPQSCRSCTRFVRSTSSCLSRVPVRFSASFTRRPPPYRRRTVRPIKTVSRSSSSSLIFVLRTDLPTREYHDILLHIDHDLSSVIITIIILIFILSCFNHLPITSQGKSFYLYISTIYFAMIIA